MNVITVPETFYFPFLRSPFAFHVFAVQSFVRYVYAYRSKSVEAFAHKPFTTHSGIIQRSLTVQIFFIQIVIWNSEVKK